VSERARLDDFNAIPADSAEARKASAPPRRRSFAEVKPRSVRWLVRGVIPRLTSTLVAGIGGLGKSTYLLGVAAQTTRGDLDVGPSSVIVISYEDTAAEVVRPRLEAAGADLDRVFEILIAPDEGGAVILPRDLDRLESEVEDTGARLVIIDPVLASIDVAFDAHKDQHVRIVLAQLARLAEQHDCAAALVLHLNKAPSTDPYLRISSSTGFYNAARSVVLVVPDPEEPEEHRLVAQTKANWSRRAPVQRHVLEEIVLPHLDPETGQRIVTSRMRFLEIAEEIDRNAILGAVRSERSGERIDEAVGWLRGALADGEWQRSQDVKAAASRAGISERTLKRAAEGLDLEYDSREFPRSTWWRLPRSGQPLSTQRGPTVEPPSAKALEPLDSPVGPSLSGKGNGPIGAVECVVCDQPFIRGENGSGPVTCPSCVTRREAAR